MIEIKEIRPPKKVSGLSSLWVTMGYDERTIAEIKSLGGAYWHKKDLAWEVPMSKLRQMLDSFTFRDNIELTLLPDEREPEERYWELSEKEISDFKVKPFLHQIDAINYGLDPRHRKWLLLDTMGIGKTNQMIWLAETLKRRGKIDHCLIICGVDSLRQNWKREIGRFSTESCRVLGEKISKSGTVSYTTVKERYAELKKGIDEFFLIVNAATLRSDEFIEAMKKSKSTFGMIAVDEAHCFATKSSLQGANLMKLRADYQVAATGTPITNSPISAYVPLSWTDNDKATLTGYKSQYCVFGGFRDSQVIGYKDLNLLKEEIDNCSLRRTLDQVREDMPKKTVVAEVIEMDDRHRKFYEAVKAGVKEEVDKVELTSSNLLALTTRLRQATADPGILTTEKIPSSKVERAAEMVRELTANGEKVVVLSCFKEPINRLAELLSDLNPIIGTGDQKDDDVAKGVDRFQTDPKAMIFLGTHSKCGTGITLNAASHMICIDEMWTAAKNNQSFDRIYRVSNTRPAFITVLTCANTIDERVHEIAQKKQDLSDYVIDGKEGALGSSLKSEMISALRDL